MSYSLENKKLKDQEIDLIDIFKKLWNKRVFILKNTFILLLIILAYSLSLNNVYEASSTFYPHYEKNEQNSIKGLAGLAGINLTNQASPDIPSNLYPNLVASTPFKNKILNLIVTINKEDLTYRNYLINKKKSFLSFFNNQKNNEKPRDKFENYIVINEKDFNLHKDLDKIIKIQVNGKDGYIRLSVEDEIPSVAAEIAKKAEMILQESIINYKLKNIRSLYDFTVSQLEMSKKSFYLLQDSLAKFKDRNKNIRTDIFLNQLDRIEKEYDIASTIYNELAINKEKTAIDVKKNTPIFTIINPVTLPIEKSHPKRMFILIVFTLFGFIIISLWVIIKDNLKSIIKKISS